MSRTRKILLGTVAVVGIGGAGLLFSGVGSQSVNTAKLELISAAAASGSGHHRFHRRGGHGFKMMCSDRRADKLEDAIGFVEAFFSFNAGQKTAWAGLADALRGGSDAIGTQCAAMKTEGRPKTAPDGLAKVETMLTAGLQVVQNVRPAFDTFYGTLDEKQRAAIDKMIQRRGRH